MRPISRETILERRQPLMHWSAVFAGAFLALGLWILLQTLGMGLGLNAVDTDNTGNLRAVGIGTGIWSVIAPLIAMFIGAVVAGRLDGSRSRGVGAIHGAVMWGLVTAIGLWILLSIVSALASGVARVGGAAASATGTVIGGAASAAGEAGGAMKALGIDANDLLAPVNRRLAQEGKPQVTEDQLNATLRAIAQRGVRGGGLDRNAIVEEVARNTPLSRADAEDVATQISQRYDAARTRVGSAAEQVKETAASAAQEAADKTGKALLAGGVMMVLSLGAALGGGALGARRRDDAKRDEIRRDEIRRDEIRREEIKTGIVRPTPD